jgi:DNA ligase-1
VSPQKGPTIADYFRKPPKGPPDAASAAAASPRSEPVVVDLRGSSDDDEAAPPPPPRRHRLSLGAAVELVGLSNAEFNGRRGVVAAPPADLAAGRIAVDVDGRTLSLKRENVVAARSASLPRAAPPPPPPPTPTVEPSSVDDALPDFDPARGLDAVLAADGRPAYAIVARALDAVSATRSRLAKEVALTNSLRWALAAPTTSAQDLAALCYLLAPTRDSQGGGHRLEPDWQHVALGLPSKAIAAGCAAGAGASPDALKAAARRTGGLADAVVALRAGPPSFFKAKAPEAVARSRSAADVRASLRALGRARSDRAKVDGIAALVRMTRGHEAKWLVKTLPPAMQGVGISLEATVLPCLGRAALVRCKGPRVAKTDLQRAGKAIREAYARRGDVEIVAEAVLGVIRGGESDFHGALEEALGRACRLAPGVPPAPMLANPANSVKDAVARLLKYKKGGKNPAIAVERKYDGQRAAIHRTASGEVRIFNRKNDDMTAKYPDVVEYVNAAAPRGVAFCLDAEIVPVGEDNKPRPFQELSTRKRVDVASAVLQPRVRVALFDLLWLGAEDITSRPLTERRRALKAAFPAGRDVCFADDGCSDVGDLMAEDVEETIMSALHDAVDAGTEGLMLKRLDAPYEFSTGSTRSNAWVKLKKDYLDGLGDSFDLVVIGGWRGQGRKNKWVSPVLVAARDPATGALGSVCRVMSGLKDEFYREFTTRMLGGEISDDRRPPGSRLLRAGPAPGVVTGETCKYWFNPEVVWEVKGADLSLSPVHKAAAGLVHAQRGISLRFPRFLRERPDKSVRDAATFAEVAERYRAQSNVSK